MGLIKACYIPLICQKKKNVTLLWVGSSLAVVEGLALLDLGVSPYSGDVFHEVPAACLHLGPAVVNSNNLILEKQHT